MRVNLVHCNSLPSKMAILPTFSEQKQHFTGENHKTRTYNLHHRKGWSVAVILSLRVGVQHKQKEVRYFFQRGGSIMYTVSCKASYSLMFKTQYTFLVTFSFMPDVQTLS